MSLNLTIKLHLLITILVFRHISCPVLYYKAYFMPVNEYYCIQSINELLDVFST